MNSTTRFVITEVYSDRKQFLPLLLIGDESETMIDRYIGQGNLYAGFLEGVPIAVVMTVSIDSTTVEVKNLAVADRFRRQGYGRRMLRHIENRHPGKNILIGTGETPSTLRFYKSCGFTYSHRIPDFFTDNYPDPIIEEGVRLRDMIYLKKSVSGGDSLTV